MWLFALSNIIILPSYNITGLVRWYVCHICLGRCCHFNPVVSFLWGRFHLTLSFGVYSCLSLVSWYLQGWRMFGSGLCLSILHQEQSRSFLDTAEYNSSILRWHLDLDRFRSGSKCCGWPQSSVVVKQTVSWPFCSIKFYGWTENWCGWPLNLCVWSYLWDNFVWHISSPTCGNMWFFVRLSNKLNKYK